MRLWALVVVFALLGMGSMGLRQEALSAWLLTLTGALAVAAALIDANREKTEAMSWTALQEAAKKHGAALESLEQRVEHISKVNALRNLG